MASSLVPLALRLHIRGEKHDAFSALCAYHLRAAIPNGETIDTTAIDTACVNFLEAHGAMIWPMYQEARTHLLDSPGDTKWKLTRRNKLSVITGPRFLTDSKPAPKQTGPFERLSSRLGKVVKLYFEALAAEPALWSGDCGENVEVLLNNILAVKQKKAKPRDGLTDDIASELWLRDAHALKSIAMHHLCKVVPESIGRSLDGGQLSDHESKIEEAVVSFMDAHGSILWPLHRQARKHLRQQAKRTKASSYSQGLYSTATMYWDPKEGPVLSLHGRMPKPTVKRWKEKYRGNQPSERELVACSKIGQVLKTYFTELLRTGQVGEQMDDATLKEIEARLRVTDVEPEPASKQDAVIAATSRPATTIDLTEEPEDVMASEDSTLENRTYSDMSSSPPPNYLPTDQLHHPTANDTNQFDHDAFEQAFPEWRMEVAAKGIDLSPAQPTTTDNSTFAVRADSIFSSSSIISVPSGVRLKAAITKSSDARPRRI